MSLVKTFWEIIDSGDYANKIVIVLNEMIYDRSYKNRLKTEKRSLLNLDFDTFNLKYINTI